MMRKLYPLVLFLFFFNFYSKAQYVDIHTTTSYGMDDFRDFLLAKYPGCFNAAGLLDTTCTEITTEDSLTYNGSGPALDLTAIQYFDALQYFNLIGGIVALAPARFPSTLITMNLHAVRSINVPSYYYLAIPPSSLPAGLQNLTYDYTYSNFSGTVWPAGLKYLNIDHASCDNGVGTLPSTLETLICSNQVSEPNYADPFELIWGYTTLTTIPSLPASLVHFDCRGCKLNSLPPLPATLTWLDCANNYSRLPSDPGDTPIPVLTSLPALPAGLIYLSCGGNRLTSLPALPPSLVYLNCAGNKYFLRWEYSMGNYQDWDYPGISVLPALPATLQYLNCSYNGLATLPPLPPVLSDLSFQTGSTYAPQSVFPPNRISSLPALPHTLTYLNCSWNPIACLPHLPASMSVQSPFNNEANNLIIDNTQINCIPNSVPGIRIQGTWPLCNTSNNTNGCEMNHIIAGNVFYDNNSNGIQDAGELPRANVRANYSTGLQTFTDNNGYYEGTVDIGSNTVTVVPPVYYDAVPATLTHAVSAADMMITDLVALQPNTMVDSLEITITGYHHMFASDYVRYCVKYDNVGTTILDPNIVINYSISSNVYYSGSNNSSVVNNTGTHSLSLALGNFQPGQHGEFYIYFSSTMYATLGDGCHAVATITGGTSTSSDATGTVVDGSFDPNEKQATPTLTTQKLADGAYIDYVILFQNTGTASANNVVLADTLSALLQENTLEMVATSHNCRTTQSGNKLHFEFVNINLPDSNANEPDSHGFVRFRVKPVTTLVAGDIVPNQASIYFDYNAAVQTNIATTTIEDVVVVDPISLLSFDVQKHDATAEIYWTTAHEINSKEFIVERSLDGNVWNGIATVNAAGNSSVETNYNTNDLNPAKGMNYYRLKQIDLGNNFKYSEIRSVYFDSNVVVVTNMNEGLGPNPARGKVTVYLPGNTAIVSINIYNMKGQLVKKLTSDKEISPINIPDLSRGVYVVKIKGGRVNMVKKLVVN